MGNPKVLGNDRVKGHIDIGKGKDTVCIGRYAFQGTSIQAGKWETSHTILHHPRGIPRTGVQKNVVMNETRRVKAITPRGVGIGTTGVVGAARATLSIAANTTATTIGGALGGAAKDGAEGGGFVIVGIAIYPRGQE